jgi:hypothetical protein
MTADRSPVLGTQNTKPLFSFPLTATQSRVWYLDQLAPGNPALNVAVRWELRGSIHDETVEAAFSRIIARHEILRTRFVECKGIPAQEVMPSADFKLSVVDLRTMPAEKHAEQIEAYAEKGAAHPFDLSELPLLRATLVRTAPASAMLLIVAHQGRVVQQAHVADDFQRRFAEIPGGGA